VQKGNPPTERKIQRLFRQQVVSQMIKRCNDFGAGGVSVAIGELTDGLVINLDAVPKKYEGLDGTELAISESQERMAVVVAAQNVAAFIRYGDVENLEVTPVAEVTAEPRLKMIWRGQAIVDISREFLNTNGVGQTTTVKVTAPSPADNYFALDQQVSAADLRSVWLACLQDINIASQKGLGERFDSTIGAATVIMPFGGKYQATPAAGMVAKLPVMSGETTTGTIMTYGYNPKIGKWSPFHGGMFAVVEAVTKVVALGGDLGQVRLSLQEYFEKLGQAPTSWGKPFSALLGAYYAQKQLGIGAIGGKDSMSGTFKELNVPPTLIAFAVAPVDVRQVISQEFKKNGNVVYLISQPRDSQEIPDFAVMKQNLQHIHELIVQKKIVAAHPIGLGGVAAAVSKMCFGNGLGFNNTGKITPGEWFAPNYGSILLEMASTAEPGLFSGLPFQVLGHTTAQPIIKFSGGSLTVEEAYNCWSKPLEEIFPTQAEAVETVGVPDILWQKKGRESSLVQVAKPRIFIPVFPGTNCEEDSALAFTKAGGQVEMLVVRNLTAVGVEESIAAMVKYIRRCQIIMLPGGFSAGDEPDGSAKFIATMFRNPYVKEAVTAFLEQGGLMLGICNGFQALIKLGLVPYGKISDAITPDCPTLTFNTLGRHVSTMVQTKVVSSLSPWLAKVAVGDVHTVAVSHGEGRFVANPATLKTLIAQGQIATQYVDFANLPSNDIQFNPNGSVAAIEAITSPDGRILGKMAHSERMGNQVGINIPGNKDQQLFAAGIGYFN
jgi:phosphoribosylformylglycinamidine synthase